MSFVHSFIHSFLLPLSFLLSFFHSFFSASEFFHTGGVVWFAFQWKMKMNTSKPSQYTKQLNCYKHTHTHNQRRKKYYSKNIQIRLRHPSGPLTGDWQWVGLVHGACANWISGCCVCMEYGSIVRMSQKSTGNLIFKKFVYCVNISQMNIWGSHELLLFYCQLLLSFFFFPVQFSDFSDFFLCFSFASEGSLCVRTLKCNIANYYCLLPLRQQCVGAVVLISLLIFRLVRVIFHLWLFCFESHSPS